MIHFLVKNGPVSEDGIRPSSGPFGIFFHPDLVAIPCIAPLFALLITVFLEPPSPWLKKAVSLFLPENDQTRMETESCFLKPEREIDLSLGDLSRVLLPNSMYIYIL